MVYCVRSKCKNCVRTKREKCQNRVKCVRTKCKICVRDKFENSLNVSERVRSKGENCGRTWQNVSETSLENFFFLERDRKCQNQVRGQCQNMVERARTKCEN